MWIYCCASLQCLQYSISHNQRTESYQVNIPGNNPFKRNTANSQDIIGMTLHEVNQHVAKQTIGPSKPRTSVAVHTVLEVALVHVSIGRTLLQPVNALKNLLLVLLITIPLQCNVRCIRSDNERHGPDVARAHVRSSNTLSRLSL